MKHMMVDCETLGQSPGTVILSCAAVHFDMAGPRDRGRRWNVDIRSSMDAGLVIEPVTLQWWLSQKPGILQRQATDPITLKEFLMRLGAYYYLDSKVMYVWSHATFDMPILAAAYASLGLKPPWAHKMARDLRTIFWLAEHFGLDRSGPKAADKHDPLADCHRQIDEVQDAWQTIVKG